MQRIELDFIRRRPASRWAGRVLLAVALGMAGDLAFTYVELQREVRSNEAVLARAQPGKPVPSVSKEELALAKDTVERLALPWPRLFAALESAANDQVGGHRDAAHGRERHRGERQHERDVHRPRRQPRHHRLDDRRDDEAPEGPAVAPEGRLIAADPPARYQHQGTCEPERRCHQGCAERRSVHRRR